MKSIKYVILFALIFGGIVVTAGSCEACNVAGAFGGLAMMGVGVMLANRWEGEMVG